MASLQASSCSSSVFCKDAIAAPPSLSSSASSFISTSTSLPLPCCQPVSPLKPAYKPLAKCSISEDDNSASSSLSFGRRALASVIATGAALSVFVNVADAAIGPGGDGARRTAEKADSLLKAADKLNIEDAPPRFGPGRDGAAQDPTKISQIAGSGPLATTKEGLTDAAKGTSGAAKGAVSDVKKKSGGFFGFGKKQSDTFADNAKDALSQAKGKTDEIASNVKKTVGRDGFGRRIGGSASNVASKVEGANNALGQAQSKKGQLGDAAKDAIGQAQSKTNLGNSGGGVLKPFQESLQGVKENVGQTGADARNAVSDVVSKSLP